MDFSLRNKLQINSKLELLCCHRLKPFMGVTIIWILICYCIMLVNAQYDGAKHQQSSYGFQGGYNDDNQEYNYDDGSSEERPKVHLGIRLRIPAIKFELPRFNMPKITVSAKIRQPNRPRTITLPEINLDTSSKVAAPGGEPSENQPPMNSDGREYYEQVHTGNVRQYQASGTQFDQPMYDQANGYQQQTITGSTYSNGPDTTLSFSTQQDNTMAKRQQRYQSMDMANFDYRTRAIPLVPNRYVTQNGRYHNQQHMISGGSIYAATNVRPTYIVSNNGKITNYHRFPSMQPVDHKIQSEEGKDSGFKSMHHEINTE